MRWLLTFIMLVLQGVAFGDDAIGEVVAVEGQASAENSTRGNRTLKRGSSIYVADTIVVASASKAQIKFSDGGILNLIADTEFRVDEYRYKKLFKKDRFSAELAKGGFRSMTGSIAKKNPNEYEIKTPTSTIGIRGTVLEARMVDNRLFVGVETGQVVVRNGAGSITIGQGAPNQFAVVPAAAPPQALPQRPPVLNKDVFVEPKGGHSIDQIQQKAPPPAANRMPSGGTSSTEGSSTGSTSSGEGAAASSDSGGGTSTEASGAEEGVAAETETAPSGGDSSGSGSEGAAASSDSGGGGQTFDSFGQTSTTDSGDFSGGESTLQSGGSSVSISGGC